MANAIALNAQNDAGTEPFRTLFAYVANDLRTGTFAQVIVGEIEQDFASRTLPYLHGRTLAADAIFRIP